MSLGERLSAGSLRNESSGCVEWVRHRNPDGYGMLWLDGKAERTHRAAWIAAHGPIPAGKHVLHKCDNRCCVNVDHLFLGTNSDNVADKVAKRRQYFPPDMKGEKHPNSKLTDEKVREIRRLASLGLSNRHIAKAFAVSVMTVSFIRNFKTWTHVPMEAAQ